MGGAGAPPRGGAPARRPGRRWRRWAADARQTPAKPGCPAGRKLAGRANRPEGRKSDPVMGRSFGAGENYSATTMGASGAFLRTLSMPLRQLALAL